MKNAFKNYLSLLLQSAEAATDPPLSAQSQLRADKV